MTRGRLAAAWIVQFFVAVYGGYFGAGVSILMLAVLGFLGVADIHAANGLKNFFVLCINGVAAIWFIAQRAVHWPAALVLIAGAVVGGYAGARFGRSISRDAARRTVVGIGIAVVVALFLMR